MPNTTRQVLPYPDGAAPPNGPAQIQSLAQALDSKIDRVVANQTERNALTTFAGMTVYQTDIGALLVRVGTTWQLAKSQKLSNPSVNSNNTAVGTAWQGTAYAWDTPLGSKVTVPGDGIARSIEMDADCNIAGDGWMRIRVDVGGTTSYWPNSNGKRSVAATNQEQDLSIVGTYEHTGAAAASIYLEAKATTAGSATMLIPVLRLRAF